MVLSDRSIRAEIEAGRIVIDPYDASLIQPSSGNRTRTQPGTMQGAPPTSAGVA